LEGKTGKERVLLMLEQDKQGQYLTPSQVYSSNMVLLTNPNSELWKLELTYRGCIEKQDGTIEAIGHPLMNERGISSVLGLAQSIVNRITIMGNVKDAEIKALIDLFADVLSRDLMMNRINYNIGIYKGNYDCTARDKVFIEAVNLVFFTMKRSLDQGDRIFWSKTTQEIKSTVQSNTQKKGLLAAITPFGKDKD
jgi:hypothetical protein